jgi:inorganic pyrophosphatase
MFFEQIQECFVGEFLKVLHAVVCEEIKSMPRLVVELNTFTGHRRFFANIGVDILSTIGSPECSMEQIAVSGIYGTGPVAALLRNGSGGGAACEGCKMTDYVTLPTWADTEHLFAVVETPRGSRAKLKFDVKLGIFTLAKPLLAGLTYPYDWGFIPSTRAEDGDPLDVLIIHDAATYPGLVLKCRPIGVLEVAQSTKQKKERNDRIFAVPDRSPFEGDLQDIRHLPRRAIEELEKFFEATDALETKTLTFKGWHGPGRATKTIRKASI